LLLERIGFDFERGRMDASVHPFTTSFDSSDVRVTTRYHEKWLPAALFGILHEGGHALYEQGLSPSGSSSENRDYVGTPLREALSLSIHESQSRFWENQVGRSRPFWECFFPTLRDCFPQNLSEVTVDDFYFASNMVRPSPIRVEADEVSYNLHIGMRYELEKSLLRDDVSVGELPGAWNELSRKLLGFEPKDDAEGVLQDIHWSMGLFGYFPTYLLGNLYAAQWAAAAKRHLTGWDDLLRGGKLRPILGWLRENVHRHGRRYTAAELVVRATGSELDPAFYDRYLRNRYGELYGVTWSAPTHENENDQGS
jgi:carboxypeptidase Taq